MRQGATHRESPGEAAAASAAVASPPPPRRAGAPRRARSRRSAAALAAGVLSILWHAPPAAHGTLGGDPPPGAGAPFASFGRTSLHIKLTAASGITLASDGSFTGGAADQVQQLNRMLVDAGRTATSRLAPEPAGSAPQERVRWSLRNYYAVRFAGEIDTPAVSRRLERLDVVEAAYPEPVPAPPPATPSFVGLQAYLQATPAGIDTNYAAHFPGGGGEAVTIFDIEYSWNTDHEDLTRTRGALIPIGTPSDPFADRNHGTAVLGALVGDANDVGVTGAVPAAGIRLVNAYSTERGYDPVHALYVAAGAAEAGDVVLVEQQAYGPSQSPGYVPLEWIPAVYDAIAALTADGVQVVEAAGNGSQDLDDQAVFGNPFPLGKPDSGAIIAGAGLNCAGSVRLARAPFSTYGARINLQGPGECVASTGYGDLYGAAGPNAFYTQRFNGTSSASPVVAAAAAAMSSSYKTLNGAAATPAQIRKWLRNTGTAQTGDPSGNIGPYPNLRQALLLTDRSPPTTPDPAAWLSGNQRPVLSWTPSADNVSVKTYKVYRNGTLYASVTAPGFTDVNVTSGKTYGYAVAAKDWSGNVSPVSATVRVSVP
ncbi:MAG TPA: S8 family serine peptidase [Acidimicrobiales bacterium]|nr:S8 family serine peptidase [Acidimicrobiales bacterium]